MIIKFSKDLELSDWIYNFGYFARYNHRSSGGIITYDNVVAAIFYENDIATYCRFYNPLFQLDKLYRDNIVLNCNLNFAKNSVDNFLIKMSRLTAFL